MKKLAIHFLKRWWGLYLVVFILDTSLYAGAESLTLEYARGMVAAICVIVFLDFLQKGGNGVFWLPLTCRQIGLVYWAIAIFFPAVIFTGSGLLGIWLNDSENISLIWRVLNHGLIFTGILSALISIKNFFTLLPIIFVLFMHWSKFFSESLPAVKIALLILSVLFIVMTFLRADQFLVTRTPVSKPKPRLRKRSWWNLFKASKQTGMAWVLATTLRPVIRSFVAMLAGVILLRLFTKFALDDRLVLIFFVGLLPSLGSASLLISNLRVTRLLPLSTNQLAGWLIGITCMAIILLGLLMIPIAIISGIPLASVLLWFLAILEGFLVLQTTVIFVGERGLQGVAAIVSTIIVLFLVSLVFIYFKFFTETRLILSILISVPIAFLIHRHCLKVGSDLYRPQKETRQMF